jgi:hypothetical protein
VSHMLLCQYITASRQNLQSRVTITGVQVYIISCLRIRSFNNGMTVKRNKLVGIKIKAIVLH